MEKIKSEKLKKWTRLDIYLNILVYVLNFILIVLLFVGAVYLNTNKEIGDVFSLETISSPLHFMVLIVLIIAVMGFYFAFEDKDFLKEASNSEMLFLALEISLISCYLCGRYISVYVRPLALCALLITFLTNRRSAIFMNLIFCVMMFLFDSFSGTISGFNTVEIMSLLVMGVASGVLSVYCTGNVYSRFKLLLESLIISIPSVVCIIMKLLDNGGEITAELVSGIFSGPIAIVIFMVALPIFEYLFRRVSCFKFAELTDHKSKLIKRLIIEAPGTFNHSIVVSNIAEACASAIGEDALLARTCAYYHDVGKLRRPEFFKENEMEKDNPHQDLTPELSAKIIKCHTIDGYNLILKNSLPKEIADVCREHHGTLPIVYFYDKAKKFTEGNIDIKDFCYVGPKPQTKIAAIVMIADGCEAAARTLKERSRETVKKTVQKIVSDRMKWGQFDECEITLKELNIIMHTVVNNLTGIYHNRIEYPKVSLTGLETEAVAEGTNEQSQTKEDAKKE